MNKELPSRAKKIISDLIKDDLSEEDMETVMAVSLLLLFRKNRFSPEEVMEFLGEISEEYKIWHESFQKEN